MGWGSYSREISRANRAVSRVENSPSFRGFDNAAGPSVGGDPFGVPSIAEVSSTNDSNPGCCLGEHSVHLDSVQFALARTKARR
jgi:hypothetical protein